MGLFQRGLFTANSGKTLSWKIECDFLTESDLRCLAMELVVKRFKFKQVVSIPTGGDRLAKILQEFIDPESGVTLIVDDVLTTGNSMNKMYAKLTQEESMAAVYGIVIFNRTRYTPIWIRPLLTLGPDFVDE